MRVTRGVIDVTAETRLIQLEAVQAATRAAVNSFRRRAVEAVRDYDAACTNDLVELLESLPLEKEEA